MYKLNYVVIAKVGVVLVCAVVCFYVVTSVYSTKQHDFNKNVIELDTPTSANHQPVYKHMTIQQVKKHGFDFRKATAELSAKNVSMDDKRLIDLIRNYWIENPSDSPYNLASEQFDYSMGQAPLVDHRLKFKENGFYIECGALDGETRSNSLFFERIRKWNGLLIEADPSNYEILKQKNRKAFTINACLSPVPRPVVLTFKQNFNQGRLSDGEGGSNTVQVQCFPLYSILLALGVDHVDYFSLDVEGHEMEVLKTVPFRQVHISMMSVEYEHGQGGDIALKNLVEKFGYQTLLKIQHYNKLANDLIFKKH